MTIAAGEETVNKSVTGSHLEVAKKILKENQENPTKWQVAKKNISGVQG